MALKLPSRLAAVVLFAVSGSAAHAGDLPKGAAPDLSQALCSMYGSGFAAIPGTDTCLRIGGRVRVDGGRVGGDFDTSANSSTTTTTRGEVRFESRTQTDIGTIRIVIDKDLTLGPEEP
jgi:hypothetical protein